jgi:hypothetical protein
MYFHISTAVYKLWIALLTTAATAEYKITKHKKAGELNGTKKINNTLSPF